MRQQTVFDLLLAQCHGGSQLSLGYLDCIGNRRLFGSSLTSTVPVQLPESGAVGTSRLLRSDEMIKAERLTRLMIRWMEVSRGVRA